jgi:hypothetical protein
MFTGVQMLIAIIITGMSVAFVCTFVLGASTLNREADAYQEGYYKGYEDGKKVGGANDI